MPKKSGQCFGFPPFIIYFVHQVVPAAINSSQLKPNNHDFLKLVFRSCKVENIYVHKLVGFDRANLRNTGGPPLVRFLLVRISNYLCTK